MNRNKAGSEGEKLTSSWYHERRENNGKRMFLIDCYCPYNTNCLSYLYKSLASKLGN